LKFFENTLLYITVGSFSNGGGEKVCISASSAVGEGCDPTVIPSFRTAAMLCGDQVLVCTHGRGENRGGRSLLHWPLPPSPLKTPVTDGRTDKTINILDLI
jgi:hypothetical protein